MYKVFALVLATASSAATFAQPASSQSIVVTSEVHHREFVERVSRDLDRQLAAAARVRNAPSGEGISIIRFTRSSKGEVEGIKIYRASGKGAFDQIAMRAVSRLRSLESAPADVHQDQVYQANIIFAETPRDAEDLKVQLAAEESVRVASELSERKVIAFGGTATSRTS